MLTISRERNNWTTLTLLFVNYEVGDERWSLATLDKQIAQRREDTKIIPKRAARLDVRALARINYSTAAREQAARDVELRLDLARAVGEEN